MKKSFLTFMCVSVLTIGCSGDPQKGEAEIKEQNQAAASKSISSAQEDIQNLLKYFTTEDYQKSTAHLTKEEAQKDMAMKLLPKCKELLIENGYSHDDFATKFNNDYKLIILAAFNLKK